MENYLNLAPEITQKRMKQIGKCIRAKTLLFSCIGQFEMMGYLAFDNMLFQTSGKKTSNMHFYAFI